MVSDPIKAAQDQLAWAIQEEEDRKIFDFLKTDEEREAELLEEKFKNW